MMVLPGSNKTFDQFRGDDYNCRQFALGQIGGVSSQQAANTLDPITDSAAFYEDHAVIGAFFQAGEAGEKRGRGGVGTCLGPLPVSKLMVAFGADT
ncbi:hypothetical protein [Cupriavidus sp. DF5525]|uniref:hypothetical protein n=1 Tax=Cupriavidus sp. DF5525 TaxID=3160989 RepID=UPI0035A8FDD8